MCRVFLGSALPARRGGRPRVSASRADSSRGELAMTPSSSLTFQGKLCLRKIHFLSPRKLIAARAPQSAREGARHGGQAVRSPDS